MPLEKYETEDVYTNHQTFVSFPFLSPVTDAAPLLGDSHSLEVGDLQMLEPPDRISIESSLSVHTADSHLSTSMDSDSITPSTFLEELNQDLSPSSQPLFLQSEASTPSQALSLEGDDGSLQETPLGPPSVEGE